MQANLSSYLEKVNIFQHIQISYFIVGNCNTFIFLDRKSIIVPRAIFCFFRTNTRFYGFEKFYGFDIVQQIALNKRFIKIRAATGNYLL